MSETATRLRNAIVARALDGPARASRDERRSAFDNTAGAEVTGRMIDKVAHRAWTIGDEDVAAVKAAGVSDDAIFELVICAALGQATRQFDAAIAALKGLSKERS
jgi:hypothetical protein